MCGEGKGGQVRMGKLDRRVVFAGWDARARVWVATSDEVPGLVTESATIGALQDKLQDLVPQLLRANGAGDTDDGFELVLRQLPAH